MQTVRFGIGIAECFMLFGLILFQTIPETLLSLFNATDEMLSLGIPALRSISLSFPFAAICICFGSVFQAMGNGVYSLIASVSRQLLALIPLAYVLSMMIGLNAIWLSFPLAEIVSILISVILFIRIYRMKIRPLSQPLE